MTGRPPKNMESKLFQDVVWGAQHDAFERRPGRCAIRAYRRGVVDDLVTEFIHGAVHPLQIKEVFGDLCPFRKPHFMRGQIFTGYDAFGNELILPLKLFNSGMFAGGNTGSGKTTLISRLACGVAATGSSVWLADMYKKHQRHLRRAFQRLGRDLVILRSRDWKYNVFQADNRDPRAHLSMTVDSMDRELGLPSRSRTILAQGVHALYAKFGIWNGQCEQWPHPFYLFEWVRTTSGLNPAAREAILDRLGAWLTALTPRCGAYIQGWNPVKLGEFSIVFEMRGMPEYDKSIRLQSLLFSIFQHEVECGEVNRPLDQWICFEDAQRYFRAHTEVGGGEITPLEELAGVIRGAGKGLCATAQTLHGLSRGLLPNMASKIMARLGSHEDYQHLGADMSMSSAQIEWAKAHLRPGQFIMQCNDEWRAPFVLNVPPPDYPFDVNDDEAAESVQALDVLPTIFDEAFAGWQPVPVITTTLSLPGPQLTDAERRFLDAVLTVSGRPSGEYARRAGLSGKAAVRVRKRLIDAGFLREHRAVLSGRGRAAIVLEPLKPAYELFGRDGGS